MKKFGFLLLNLFLLAAVSCSSRTSGLESGDSSHESSEAVAEMLPEEVMQTIEAANAQCPINLGMGNNVVMEGISYSDKTLIYRYSVARILNDLKDDSKMKESVILMIKAEAEMTPANKQFMQAIAKSGSKLVYKYYTQEGDSTSVEVSNKELREAMK